MLRYGGTDWISEFYQYLCNDRSDAKHRLAFAICSYGLTSLMSLFIGLGLVLNVGLQARKYHGLGDIE